MKNKQAGYTLLELIVVMGIIGVLMAVAIPAFSNFNAPQSLRAGSLQLKSDLRTLQNRALNGVAAIRSYDISPVDGLKETPLDTRVYWVARFKNNADTYETASCQKNDTIIELWNNAGCQDKEIKKLPTNVKTSVCSGSCAGLAVYFAPIYGTIEVYNANNTFESIENSYPAPPTVALFSPSISPVATTLNVTLTSSTVPTKSIILSVNKDGSIVEQCKSGAAVASCQ